MRRVLLVGVNGHGRWHLENVLRWEQRLPLRLAGVCDIRPLNADIAARLGDRPVSADLEHLLRTLTPDITIVATPIDTHVDLALTAVAAGSHVLLEKPPAPTLASFDRLRAGIEQAGLDCQVGFQSLGSAALPELRAILTRGELGDVVGIGAAGTWVRDSVYYSRAPWAGRRQLDGRPVVDGALTNPFAHAVATALAIAGADDSDDIVDVTVELYRANPIEADDTSCARITTAGGTTITIAVTLCAETSRDPYLVVHGTRGRAVLWYTRDRLRVEVAGRVTTTEYGRVDLLANLVARIHDPRTPLLVPLSRTRAFTRVLEAVRLAPDPLPIPDAHQQVLGSDGGQRRVIPGVDEAVARSARTLTLFSEQELPWASPRGSPWGSGTDRAAPR